MKIHVIDSRKLLSPTCIHTCEWYIDNYQASWCNSDRQPMSWAKLRLICWGLSYITCKAEKSREMHERTLRLRLVLSCISLTLSAGKHAQEQAYLLERPEPRVRAPVDWSPNSGLRTSTLIKSLNRAQRGLRLRWPLCWLDLGSLWAPYWGPLMIPHTPLAASSHRVCGIMWSPIWALRVLL